MGVSPGRGTLTTGISAPVSSFDQCTNSLAAATLHFGESSVRTIQAFAAPDSTIGTLSRPAAHARNDAASTPAILPTRKNIYNRPFFYDYYFLFAKIIPFDYNKIKLDVDRFNILLA
jgi:hypothetical protein